MKFCKDDMRIGSKFAWEQSYCKNCHHECKFDPIQWANEQDNTDVLMDFIDENQSLLTEEEIKQLTALAYETTPITTSN